MTISWQQLSRPRLLTLLAVNVSAKFVDWPISDGTDTARDESQWKVVAGVWTYERGIYVPAVDSLCRTVVSLFHNNPESGHFGALKITELVSRDFYWPGMDSHVCEYVSGWEVWHWLKAPRDVRHGINMPLDTPSRPSQGVTMDIVTDLPLWTASD